MATLFSVLQDGDRAIPVKTTLKFYDNGNPKLHVVINGSGYKNKSTNVEEAGTQNAHHATDGTPKMRVSDFLDIVKGSTEFNKRVGGAANSRAEAENTAEANRSRFD